MFKSLALISSLLLLASASPIEKRSDITCKSYSVEEGNTLQYKSIENSANVGNAVFNGQRDGQGRQNLVTLAADGSPAEPQGFRFWGCDGANSLGYPKGYTNTGAAYGQLRPANAPHHCVTISELKAQDARFVSAPCLTKDDENLATQYFYIAQNGLTINFLGNGNTSTYTDENYGLSVGQTSHKKIRVDYLGEGQIEAPKTGVFLGFKNNFA